MTLNILFAAGDTAWPSYRRPLANALAEAGLQTELSRSFDDPADVDYIVYAPDSPLQDFTPYTRLKLVQNLWAGVEDVVGNQTLTAPLARMVDPGLTEGMIEWVTAHVLRHHLGTDIDVTGQTGDWQERTPPLARERRVGILGLGALGTACAQTLASLNFQVAGWSRSPKTRHGLTCYHGPDGFQQILGTSEILVLLLPRTPDTENMINADALGAMPKGAVLINPGRGGLIDDDALLAALDRDHIGHATLDTFRVEPLPKDHRFWSHGKVTVTPHTAATTRPSTAVRTIAENVRRGEIGEPFQNLVDRSAGY